MIDTPKCCGQEAEYAHGGWQCVKCGYSVDGPPVPPLGTREILARLIRLEAMMGTQARDNCRIEGMRLVIELDGSCTIQAFWRRARLTENPPQRTTSRIFGEWHDWSSFDSLEDLDMFAQSLR